MRALGVKLFRDLRRLWAQALAIALVLGGGVATMVAAVGSIRSLEETRTAYYERYQFADVFALVKRAPKGLVDRIAEIPGIAAVEARIAKLALLDIPGLREPATGQFISLPDGSEPHLNRLYMRSGRAPEPGRADEVVVDDAFAKAHDWGLGSRFAAILNGRKQGLVVVGTAFSPEFIYTIEPGAFMPDDRRFGIIWMSEKALANVYNLDGTFSSVTLKLLRGASEPEVIKRLDTLLDPYGGQAAYGRKDQPSHAWGDHGLDMLRNMSRTLPPIFLLIAAFLINQWLNRFVALEREQIGLLKAFGYNNLAIAWHYSKFVIVLAAVGIVIGSTAGAWVGAYITGLFGSLLHFPFSRLHQEYRCLCDGRRAEPGCRTWGRHSCLATGRDVAAGSCHAAAGPCAVSSCSAGGVRSDQARIAANPDHVAQHFPSSAPRSVHVGWNGACIRDHHRFTVLDRHDRGFARGHLFFVRPTGFVGKLR